MKFKKTFIYIFLVISFCYLILNITSSRTASSEEVNSLPTEITDKKNNSDLLDYIKYSINVDWDNIGLVYYNLKSKECIKINAGTDFVAGSIYKLGLNLLYYELANEGYINLNDKLNYNDEFYEDGTGILKDSYLSIDSVFTIQELLDLSIIYSDNIATNILGNYLGGHNIIRQNLYELLNINYDEDENIITPEIATYILEYIYNNEYSKFDHLVYTLKNTAYNNRLNKYITNTPCAHKIGTYDNYIHDVGIFYTSSPYILSVFTKDLSNADETIAEISKIIYNYNFKN